MWERIVWAQGAVCSVEDAYKQLRKSCIRNDMDIVNLTLQTPDWLQVNLAIHLGRSWAIYNKRAVISGFHQEERFRVVSQDCIDPLCISRLTWAQSLHSLCMQFLCQQKGSLVRGTHLFLWRKGTDAAVFLPDISFGMSRVFLQANWMQ